MEIEDSPVHGSQFILAPTLASPKPEWKSVSLGRKLYLSHCPKLRVAHVSDAQGESWVLLGLAVQTEPGKPAPEEEITNSTTDRVSSLYQNWAGRWLLIGNGGIHLDASGMLGCFYRRADRPEKEAPAIWASSSLALLLELPDAPIPKSSPRKLSILDEFEWQPPPLTGYDGIRKLLPSQILDISSGKVRPRPLLAISGDENLTYERTLADLQSRLVATMQNLMKLSSPIWLALTAGYDSRLLLAAAHNAGLKFRTFTQAFRGIRNADLALPPVLSRLVGVEHRLIEPTDLECARIREFDAHCAGQNVDLDRQFYACGQWDWSQPGDVIIRGLGLEVGRCFYWKRFPGPSDTEKQPMVSDILKGFGAETSPDIVARSIEEYIAWTRNQAPEAIDWRDRFHIEVRLGGWASAQEQSLDIVDGTNFFPAISAYFFGRLLVLPERVRRTSQHHIDLIRRFSPKLLEYPFNPSDSIFRRGTRRLRGYHRLLRERGWRTTLHRIQWEAKQRVTGRY